MQEIMHQLILQLIQKQELLSIEVFKQLIALVKSAEVRSSISGTSNTIVKIAVNSGVINVPKEIGFTKTKIVGTRKDQYAVATIVQLKFKRLKMNLLKQLSHMTLQP